MSTGGLVQPDVSPCIEREYGCLVYLMDHPLVNTLSWDIFGLEAKSFCHNTNNLWVTSAKGRVLDVRRQANE